MHKKYFSLTAATLLFCLSLKGFCSDTKPMQLHTSTCLQEIITRQYTQMDWFLENVHYTNANEGGPFKQYDERLMNNAREHGLLTEQKTRTPEAEYKALKDAGIKLLSIFEKPVQLRTAQDKKIFARNRVDFDAIIHKHLLEKGEKQYTENPEQFAAEVAQVYLTLYAISFIKGQ